MELNQKQQAIVESKENRIVVLASAAAGKTRVLTERVRYLLRQGYDPESIGVITFTNLAAQELRDRLADDYRDGLIISTIHGLANRFLTRHGIDTKEIIEDQTFDRFFDLVQSHPRCVHHFNYILLDEAQDSSPQEFSFIFDMIKPEKFFVVGDLRQSIYGFRDAEPELLKSLMRQPDVVTYELDQNYRNGENILDYAKHILTKGLMTDSSVAMRAGGIVHETDYNLNTILYWINNHDTYADWAILCSTNDDIKFIMNELSYAGVPNVTFKQGEVTKTQLSSFLTDNVVKVLTRHSAKGLEFNNVIVYHPSWWGRTKEAKCEMARVNYVAATRARNILIWIPDSNTRKSKKRR